MVAEIEKKRRIKYSHTYSQQFAAREHKKLRPMNNTLYRAMKNKIAPPFKDAEFDILYGKGISKEGDILDLGVGLGVVEKSGAWYSFDGERIGQGRENVKRFLGENQDIRERIGSIVMEKTGLRKPKEQDQNRQDKETGKQG